MYADVESRGGVLEPDGIVGIKFKREKQLTTMARLDPTYAELKRAVEDAATPAGKLASLKEQLAAREAALLPVYAQIAHQFADLHDRAGRMEAKGTIRKALRWQNARRFFYWRLRRRLNEEYVLRNMRAACAPITGDERTNTPQLLAHLRAWSAVPDFDNDDAAVAVWYEDHRAEVAQRVERLRRVGTAANVAHMLSKDRDGGLDGVAQVLSMLPAREKELILEQLRKA